MALVSIEVHVQVCDGMMAQVNARGAALLEIPARGYEKPETLSSHARKMEGENSLIPDVGI